MMLQLLVLLQLGNAVTAGSHPGSIVFTCSFDSDLCGFAQSSNDSFDWNINSGGTPSIGTGPSQDVSGNGKYAYIEVTGMSQGDNAKLVKGGLSFSSKKCLSFYYHMYGRTMGTLNVYVGQKKIFTKSGDQGNQWHQAKINVTDPGASELIFEGIRGYSYTGDVAIDNVVLKECGGGGGGGGCSYDCNFDNSMCSFVQDKSDNFDWTRINGSTPSFSTGPSADHTGNGYYMYIETSSPRQQGDNAKLNSPKLRFAGNMCLMFYYHMYGADIASLNVIINGNKVFTASGDKGNKWLRAAVDVHVSGMYSVVFEGIRGSGFQGDIAIDDFRLAPGSCFTINPSTPAATSLPTIPQAYDCNFDNSMCSFVQDKNDIFDWTRINGSTPSYDTGPSTDHTGNGYYMYIETSSPRQQGDNAKLNSPKLRFAGNMCLMFYYHMYGADIARLDVIINGNKVFTASGDKGDRWLRAAVDVHVSGMYSVVFEGIRGSSFQGDIAMDDFRLAPGRCSTISPSTPATTPVPTIPHAYDCNFDNSMCSFVQDKNDIFDWTRINGSTPSYGTGPSTDHTGNGYYIYIETSSPRQQGDNAKLNSPKLRFAGNTCLMFYYHMYGADIATLDVIINGNKVFTASGDKGDKWLRAAVDVHVSGMYSVVFEGIRGSSFQGDIAIDDFQLASGSCSTISPSTPAATTLPTIPQVFNCTFDQSMCGFLQDTNDTFDWTRNRGSTPSSPTGPDADHTTGNGYFMYIETSFPRVEGDNAILVSPKLQFSGKKCLQFYYHMFGASMGKLNVFLNGARVFSSCKDKGNKWLKAEIDVSLSGMHEVKFEGIAGSSYTSDIAIDDILLVPGSCSSITPPPPTIPGTLPPPRSCGIRPHTRIVGGTNAIHGDWPWQVQLRTTLGFVYCGGTLIYPQWVLTATHCVKGISPSSIVIRAGEYNTSGVDGTEQDIKVVKVITHQSYGNPVRYSNDIALLQLEKNAVLNRYVNLVCLPFSVPEPTDGTKCWITGWGRLASGGATPNILQQAQVPIVNRTRCDKAYPGQIDDSMICAGLDQGGIDTCQGDSGGPMMCETGGKFYVHGATSWGYGCAQPGKFGVYAKVKYLLSWLNQTVSNN